MTAPPPRQIAARVSRAYRLARCALRVDGESFDLRRYPYLYDIFDDDHPDQAILKGSQLGLTVTMVLRGVDRCLSRYQRGIAYYFPTDRDVADFSRARFQRMIQDNDVLGAVVKDTDSIGLRRVGECFVYFRGANSKSGVKSIPCDEIVLDELDEMDPGQVEQIEHRIDAADRTKAGFRTELSTPTLPEFGIDASYAESDKHLWVITCAACNAEVCLEESFLEDPERVLRWVDAEAAYHCPRCDRALLRAHEGARARWECRNPGARRRGRWISQLNSPAVPPSVVLLDFEDKQRKGKLRHFYNHRLGTAYAEWDDALTDQLILEACNTTPPQTRAEGPTAMGVDVGARDLHVVVAERRSEELAQVLAFPKVASFDDVAQLGERFNVRCAVIDGMAETRAVRAFKATAPWAWDCWYQEDKRGDYDWHELHRQVVVGRTESLDASHQRLIGKRTRLPRPSQTFREEVIPQLKNLARMPIEEERAGVKTGRVKMRWVVRGTKNDHWRHALNYAEIALTRVAIAARVRRDRGEPATAPRPRGSFMAT